MFRLFTPLQWSWPASASMIELSTWSESLRISTSCRSSRRWGGAQRTCRARRPLRSTLRSSSFSRTFLVVISDSSAKAVLRQADVITPPRLRHLFFVRSKVSLAHALHYHQICRSHIWCFIQLLRIDNQIPLSILARQWSAKLFVRYTKQSINWSQTLNSKTFQTDNFDT